MQVLSFQSFGTGLARPLVAALAIAATGAAVAEPNPYYIGVSALVGHDSNLFRVADGVTPTPDLYYSVGLLGGIDQPFGRQRFYANGTVRSNRYQDITILNNTSSGLNIGLDWETIERLSGNLGLSYNESLANYGTLSDTQQLNNKKNVEKTGQVFARVQYGLVSLLSLEGTLTHNQIEYSAPEYAYAKLSQDGGSIGLKYRPSGLLTLGTAVFAARGRYPNVLQPNGQEETFDRRDLNFTANWVPTGQSTVNALLAFSKQTNAAITQRDFSGATWAVTWAYQPTGKLTFNTSINRDTGLGSSFYNFSGGQFTGVGDDSQVTTSLTVRADYAVTAKIKLNAGLRLAERKLFNTLALSQGQPPTAVEGRDNITNLSLGASWAPTRNWLVACNAGRDSRSASGLLSYPYSANTASCSAQFTLQ